MASITPDFSQGTIQTSSSPTDLAIQGDGFFIVQGSSGNTLYTRNGQFTLNSANQLVNTTGQTLLGNGVNSDYQINSTTLQPLTIPIGGTSVAQATQNVYLQGDLSPTDAVATTPQIIDSQTLSDASIEVPPNLTAERPHGPRVRRTSAATHRRGQHDDRQRRRRHVQLRDHLVNAAGQESPPSAVVGPITTTGTSGVDQSIQLSNLPAIPSRLHQHQHLSQRHDAPDTFQLAGNTTGTVVHRQQVRRASWEPRSNSNTLGPGQLQLLRHLLQLDHRPGKPADAVDRPAIACRSMAATSN